MANDRIKELLDLKTKYLSDRKMNMVEQIEQEKNAILNAVKVLKNDLEKEVKDNEKLLKGINISHARKRTENEGENIDYLDIVLDPTNDWNDWKKIEIKFKTDNKVMDITLVDYYVPFNGNNVTRFNNKFGVYFNNRFNRINIIPGKYEIDSLLEYIKNQVAYLEFNTNDNNIITIRNTLDKTFDLVPDQDSILPLLGFEDKSYKDSLFYSGKNPYNIASNEQVYFFLSGTTMEPLSLEFDKAVTINKSLKKTRNGVTMKHMILNFHNAIGQCYDFILPVKICFKITYAT